MTELVVKAPCGVEKEASSRQEAEDKEDTHDALCDECEPGGCTIERVDGSDDEPVPGVDECVHCEQPIENGHCPDCDGTVEDEIVIDDDDGDTDDWQVGDNGTPAAKASSTNENGLEQLGDSITDDPLDVLPSYMITHVDGKPTLNKRGVSVLAFHYDVEVVDHDVMLYPHESDYTAAAVRFTVERDGKQYVGHGESHVDEMSKTKLLRMAETRAYKRAVIFATGTGIVGYQEIMAELESEVDG